jgi:hypothetical protein
MGIEGSTDYRKGLMEQRSALANRAHTELSGLHTSYQHPLLI